MTYSHTYLFLSGIWIAGTCVGHNKTHNVARKRFYPHSPQALWREFYYEIMTLGFDLWHPFLGDGAILWVNSERYLEDDKETLFCFGSIILYLHLWKEILRL